MRTGFRTHETIWGRRRPYDRFSNMNESPSAIGTALSMIATLDADLFEIVLLSLQVSLGAVAIASIIALPLGALIALQRFPGRRAVVILLNAMMGLPPVVVGLMVYVLLSRAGPLGSMGLLFTPTAMLCIGVQPSDRRYSPYSSCRSAIVCRDSAAMIGSTMMLCAITIAVGVNSRPIDPSGPARDNKT